MGSVDIRVNASDASGCAFSESAPASCVRQIVANQQTIGDCNVTNSTNFCIRTVGTNQGSDAIRYVTFSTSEVILCDNLDLGGGLEIDLNYSFSMAGVPAGLYIDAIDFTADNVTDPNCEGSE